MKIGIICGCQRKRLFFARMRVRRLTHPRGFEVAAVELGVSAERLGRLKRRRPKRFVKILRRAERVFISEHIKNVVVENPLKPVLGGFAFNCVSAVRGESEFYRFLPRIIGRYKREQLLGNGSALGIRGFDADRRVEFLIDLLYREFKSIDIYIKNAESAAAEELSERVFDETGLLLGMFGEHGEYDTSRYDVFVDLQNNRLRLGRDTLVNKVELDLDLLGFDISSADLFAAAELKNCEVKSCVFC